MVSRTGGEGQVSVVRFQAADGGLIEFRSNVSTSPPAFSAGDPVRVLYPTGLPRKARIKTFGNCG